MHPPRRGWLEVIAMRHKTSLIFSEMLFQRVFFAGKIGGRRSRLEIFISWIFSIETHSSGWWPVCHYQFRFASPRISTQPSIAPRSCVWRRERERDIRIKGNGTITHELPLNPPPFSTIFILGPCPPTLRPPPSRMVGPVTVNVFRRCERRRRDRFWCF